MIRYYFLLFFILFVSVFTFFAIKVYAGETYIYILFTFVSTLLISIGFRKNAIFFDTFLGLFLWLGFWLKTTHTIVFRRSIFSEGLEGFSIPSNVFDEALLSTSIAFIALIFASFIREKFFFKYSDKQKNKISSLFIFYKKNKKKILLMYILLFVFIASSNFYLGIYQRGELAQTLLPFGLSGVYKWLLLFGLSSFATLILKYEFDLQNRTVYLVPILTLIEAFITNTSLLSRGMILNTSAVGYGMLRNLKVKNIKINLKFIFILITIFMILFLISVKLINNIRYNYKVNNNTSIVKNINPKEINPKEISIADKIVSKDIISIPLKMLVGRFVGIEGVIATANNQDKGWPLFKEAIAEKAGDYSISFYDENIITSPYINIDITKQHYISLPGFIAFFSYANSTLFLFSIIFILSLFASAIEYLAYKASGKNLIFAALIGQVIAYRYSHFGYAPAQSYLLFGSIILNIFIIYGADKILSFLYRLKQNVKQ